MTDPTTSAPIALVTGGSGGIGAAVCRKLAASGIRVAIHYHRNRAAATALADAITALGPQPLLVPADLSQSSEVERMCREVASDGGDIDYVVHCAGTQTSAMAHKTSDEQWRQAFAINLDAAFYTCRSVLPAMRRRGRGSIVLVGSASGHGAQVGASAYVAAKHGLVGLTRALALENANKGIRVNSVAPGLTDTPMVAGLDDQQTQQLLTRIPLGSIAQPEQIADLVHFVLCHATYSTGNSFHASGGVAMD